VTGPIIKCASTVRHIRFSAAPRHATGDRPQMRALGLKGMRQPFRLPRKFVLAGHISSMSFVMVVTYETHSM
jgi:hypothetical protein